MEAAGKSNEAARQREMQKNRNTDHNPEDCPVCLTAFDDAVQRPCTLPCGHTACMLCMNKLNKEGHVTCPECRVSHTVPEGGQFSASYTLEAFIRRMRNAEAAASASPSLIAGKGKGAATTAGEKEVAGLSKKMCTFLQEQEATVVATITTFQELQLQLDQYQTILTSWGEQQQQLEDRLQELVDQSRSAKKLVQQEKSLVIAKKEEVKKGEQQLHTTLETLRSLTTKQEAGVAIDEVFCCTDKAEQVVEKCQESFPDVDTITTIRKVREASNAALEAFQALQAALETKPTVTTEELRPQSDPDLRPQSDPDLRPQSDPELRPQSDPEVRLQSDPNSTIMDRLQVILSLSLKAKDLCSLTQPARSLLEAGRVFAAHQVEGQCRYARISLESGQLYLHALKEHSLPLGTATLQMSEVVPPTPPCKVFLDLSWPDSAQRRVQIHLSRNTPWGQQFVLLCTGQRGPCYANTRLLEVGDQGKPGEHMFGGDYERNDGMAGAALLPDLDKGEHWKSGQAGAVWGWWGDGPSQAAQFGITTRDREGGSTYNNVFGEVVMGMDAVVEAAQHSDTIKVTVVDCGVVL